VGVGALRVQLPIEFVAGPPCGNRHAVAHDRSRLTRRRTSLRECPIEALPARILGADPPVTVGVQDQLRIAQPRERILGVDGRVRVAGSEPALYDGLDVEGGCLGVLPFGPHGFERLSDVARERSGPDTGR
jgi:hypothetical protein